MKNKIYVNFPIEINISFKIITKEKIKLLK